MTDPLREERARLEDLLAGRLPDARGRFGVFGGRYVPEALMPSLARLEHEARSALADRDFRRSLDGQLVGWVGRPTALTAAFRLSARWGGSVWLKREDLAHTGSHAINNAVGQALLAARLGAKRVIVETGSGHHGVAAAAACVRSGLACTVFIGENDARRQAPSVERMTRFGADVVRVKSGDRTMRAAFDEAWRAWVSDPEDAYYMPSTAVGPHPYPWLVRELQSVIGHEAREQMLVRAGRLPDAVIACVGGGANAIGLFQAFLGDPAELVGCEAGGKGAARGQHAATLTRGTPGVLHGCHSKVLQQAVGQVAPTHSIAAGLDYPGVGPEQAFLQAIGRVRYEAVSDAAALAAADECCSAEGILPALEPAHALAGAKRWLEEHPGAAVLVGLSGSGGRDLALSQRERLG